MFLTHFNIQYHLPFINEKIKDIHWVPPYLSCCTRALVQGIHSSTNSLVVETTPWTRATSSPAILNVVSEVVLQLVTLPQSLVK